MISRFLYVFPVLSVQGDLELGMLIGFLCISHGLVDGVEVLMAERHPELVLQVIGEQLQGNVEISQRLI